MIADRPAPAWLWRLAAIGFTLSLVAIIGLAIALTYGLADPPRAGPLLWRDDFKHGIGRWELVTAGGTWTAREGALHADFTAPDQWVVALAPRPAGDFTFEVAAAQTEGEIGAVYGLVFGWKDDRHYSAVVINGNGYAAAYQIDGAARRAWFDWQQWPNILVGTEGNRVRLDVRGTKLLARVNDEVLAETEGDTMGKIGLLARSVGAGRVVFGDAVVWSK